VRGWGKRKSDWKIAFKKTFLAVMFFAVTSQLFGIMEIVVEAGKEDAVYDYIYGIDDIGVDKPGTLPDIVAQAAGVNIVVKSFPILQAMFS
jgi:hypothetical protein